MATGGADIKSATQTADDIEAGDLAEDQQREG